MDYTWFLYFRPDEWRNGVAIDGTTHVVRDDEDEPQGCGAPIAEYATWAAADKAAAKYIAKLRAARVAYQGNCAPGQCATCGAYECQIWNTVADYDDGSSDDAECVQCAASRGCIKARKVIHAGSQ